MNPSPNQYSNSCIKKASVSSDTIGPFKVYACSDCFCTNQGQPYPSLHHVFGMTDMHLNSAPFTYLHHRHCQSEDIIFARPLCSSPPGPSTKYGNVISSNTPPLTHLIIHPPHL